MLLLLPEITLIAVVVFFFILTRFRKDYVNPGHLALYTSALSVLVSLYSYESNGFLFFDTYGVDHFSQLFKILLSSGLFLVIYMSGKEDKQSRYYSAEHYMFLSSCTLGFMILVSSMELMSALIALEISSLSLYMAIFFSANRLKGLYQMDTGLNYLVIGVLTTGLSVFGLSYIFGLTGTTYISELVLLFPVMVQNQPLALIGMMMLLSGSFFKIALFPMHFGAPRVFQRSDNKITAYIAIIPKIGAIAFLIRVCYIAGPVESQLTSVLSVLAVLSMVFGNLSALVEKDLKRLIAYSSVAHSGFLMIGIISGNQSGMIASVYYVTACLFMNLGFFYVVRNIVSENKSLALTDLEGLSQRSPFLAFVLAMGMLAMAGLPPTLGFTGKLLLFTSGVEHGLYAVVVIAVINMGISAIYYLKIIRTVYRRTEKEMNPVEMRFSAYCYGIFIVFGMVLPAGQQ